MLKRNPFLLAVLSVVSFGIYYIVWLVKTKGELVRNGASVPTAWLLIVPIVGWYWFYRYYKAAGQITGRVNGPRIFTIHLVATALVVAIELIVDTTGADAGQSSDVQLVVMALNIICWLLIVVGITAYLQSRYNQVKPKT